VTKIEEAEPLQSWRRQHTPGRSSTKAPVRSSGVAGTARRERNALNVGDLVASGWQPHPTEQDRKSRREGRRGVGGVHGTDEGGESRWRDGASLEEASEAGKEGRLWQR
jgi:hypothetical protein